MEVSDRAYSLFDVKSINDEKRIITGIATTPSVDRMGDIVEPKGAQFALPIPFLYQHNSDKPVGHVVKAKVTASGIEVEVHLKKTDEPGLVKDRLDAAWHDIKLGLVRGLSIGFAPIESAQIDGTWGQRFIKWLWLELSAVTVAANGDCDIQTIKQFDVGAPAALGKRGSYGGLPPGASGSTTKLNPIRQETKMKTSEKIAALEARRTECIKGWEALKDLDTKTAEQKAKIKQYREEVESLDEELDDEKAFEKSVVVGTAKAVNDDPRARQGNYVPAQAKKEVPKLAPGVLFTQLIKARTISRINIMPLDFVARQMYGEDSLIYGTIVKANEVLPGTAASGNWGYDLISQEGAAVGDFVTYLRAQTIVGKFGQGNVPALNGSIRFYEPYVIQTGPGAGFWVGEAKTKPVTSFDFDRSVLTPLKMANISVLSNENIKRSDPKSDVAIRDALVEALVETEDTAFIDPANSGTSNIKPASVTNGAGTVAATGTGDADDIVMDLRALFNKFDTANNDPTSGVLIMSPKNARAAGMLLNALGQTQFPTISAMGGSIMQVPVIVSNHAGTNITMLNAKDVYYVDEGFQLDASDQVSLEMRSVPTQDGSVPTMTSMISMWQNNLVAFRAEKTVNWKKRRSTAVAYLTGAAWGGAVPES